MDVLRNGVEAPSLGFANTEGAGGDTLSLSRSPRRRKTLLTLGLMGSYETNRHSLVSQLVESYLPVDPAPRLVAVAGKADATSITSPCSADYQPCLPPPLPPRPSPLAQTHGWRLSAGVQKRTNAESETCTSKIQQGAVQIQGLQVDSSRRRSLSVCLRVCQCQSHRHCLRPIFKDTTSRNPYPTSFPLPRSSL